MQLPMNVKEWLCRRFGHKPTSDGQGYLFCSRCFDHLGGEHPQHQEEDV